MTSDRRPLIAGNWKMNGRRAALDQIKGTAQGAGTLSDRLDMVVCPPATLLYVATAVAADGPLKIGAQDCHSEQSGAFTGSISAEMIADCFATHVIVGHSERRSQHGESDAAVAAKVQAAHAAGLVAIVCVGETEEDRRQGRTLEVVTRQMTSSIPDEARAADTVVAYEPVWAIGTGLTPTPADIAAVHKAIRAAVSERFAGEGEAMRLLYGGSVKPGNAGELMAIDNVDGLLVGGASLKSDDFLAICQACAEAVPSGPSS